MPQAEALLQLLNGGSIWTPLIVAFLFVPVVYLALSADAHREYSEAVRFAVSQRATRKGIMQTKGRRPNVEQYLAVFELDAWLVGAFGVLIASIVGCGYLVPSHTSALVGEKVNTGAVQAAMSLYATVVALLVALRLSWARLALTKNITLFYASFLS